LVILKDLIRQVGNCASHTWITEHDFLETVFGNEVNTDLRSTFSTNF